MVNNSLWERVVPLAVKEAVELPLLRGPLLYPTSLDNFLPGSNLPFLKRFVEKMVECQLQRTLNEVDYLDPF